MSHLLYRELRAVGLPILCIDAVHAHKALSVRANKSDRNDANGLAELKRVGWYREVFSRSIESQRIRTLLAVRVRLVRMAVQASNHVRGVLIENGIRVRVAARMNLSGHLKRTLGQKHDLRAGSVCLNSFGAFAKWISALAMLQPGLAAAR